MITTIYHVSLSGSETMREAFDMDDKLVQEFDQVVFGEANFAVSSGTNTYSDYEVWADFHSLDAAQAFQTKLKAAIAAFEPRCEAWRVAYYAEE